MPETLTALSNHPRPLDRLAQVLVRYSTRPQPGEVVCLVGPSAAEPLLVALYREVLLAGGNPVLRMAPALCDEYLYRHASPGQLAFLNPLEVCELQAADVIVYVLATLREAGLGNVDAERLAMHHRPRLPLLQTFRQRIDAGTLRWAAAQFPGEEAAGDAGLSLAEYQALFWKAALLDRPDPAAAWQALGDRQAQLAAFPQTTRELHIVTPQGTDLRVGVAGRHWINCQGRENFPDGEVFTAPVESETSGVACFDWPAVYAGREVHGARLVVREGRVVDASAERGQDTLIDLLNHDAGARVLGEVALGCNYALTGPTRNTLLDEKIGGSFHVALGMAYPQSGGRNQSGLHWDLVGDLRRGGRVEGDGKLISENGRFVNPLWPQPEE